MKNKQRHIVKTYRAQDKLEGAGVHLHRGFGNPEVPTFDPFLLFDDFSSENPADYLPGFPMHPHRGIETVTYILDGRVEHRDSSGNAGSIGKGDVQWMTAGGGILHEEMPKGVHGIKGFQLWVNLPADHKLMPPRYQEVQSSQIPEISYGEHAVVRVIAGKLKDIDAPVKDIVAEPIYFDITVKPGRTVELPIQVGHNAFVYVFDGSGKFAETNVSSGYVGLLSMDGDHLLSTAGKRGMRYLLAAGKPIEEEIAWYGPIVMNTKEELEQAYDDLHTGHFIAP